jgi:hypothetical protein
MRDDSKRVLTALQDSELSIEALCSLTGFGLSALGEILGELIAAGEVSARRDEYHKGRRHRQIYKRVKKEVVNANEGDR